MVPNPTILIVFPDTEATFGFEEVYVIEPVLLELALILKSGSSIFLLMFSNPVNDSAALCLPELTGNS